MILILQGLMAIVIIGVVHSLWETTKSYGGLIGSALKWIGIGIMFFAVDAFDRVFGTIGNFTIIGSLGFGEPSLAYDVVLLLGLIFSGIGFSKLTKIVKK